MSIQLHQTAVIYISENTDSVVMQPKRNHFIKDVRNLAGKDRAGAVETKRIQKTVQHKLYSLTYFIILKSSNISKVNKFSDPLAAIPQP